MHLACIGLSLATAFLNCVLIVCWPITVVYQGGSGHVGAQPEACGGPCPGQQQEEGGTTRRRQRGQQWSTRSQEARTRHPGRHGAAGKTTLMTSTWDLFYVMQLGDEARHVYVCSAVVVVWS